MNISTKELDDLVLDVAKTQFEKTIFRRRRLMIAAEKRVKEIGAWMITDDILSGSAGRKSAGLANIDWAITRLEGNGLTKDRQDRWRVS